MGVPFLVPAVTMRMIAEEKRLGTIELIYSKPVTEREIVYGKYLASVALVFLHLLPGFIYYISVYILGETPGNLDKGATMGSLYRTFLPCCHICFGWSVCFIAYR